MLAICLIHQPVVGEEKLAPDDYEIVPNDARTCFFAEDKALFLYSAKDLLGEVARRVEWHVSWSLKSGARTVLQGTCEAKVSSDAEQFQYLVEIPTPPLRAGIVLPVELEMTWVSGNNKHKFTQPITIFSRDPFSVRQTLLENAQIKLIDAEGKTAALLEEYDLPHSRLLNLSAIDLVTEGLLLVGEGVSFREQRHLPQALLRAAERGVTVLCLAPSEGDFPLTLRQDNQPNRLALDRGDVVRRYDKRFDDIPTVWPMSLVPRRTEVVVSAGNRNDNWSWLNLEFTPDTPEAPPGKLIVCGLGIVSHWNDSPVPRYFFVRLLEALSQAQSTEERHENERTEN